MSTFAFPLFKNTTPDGPTFMAGIVENGVMQPVTFSGSDPASVVQAALDFANRELDTPERRARITARTEARKASLARKATNPPPSTESAVSASDSEGETA